jgi:hypothetical protein
MYCITISQAHVIISKSDIKTVTLSTLIFQNSSVNSEFSTLYSRIFDLGVIVCNVYKQIEKK